MRRAAAAAALLAVLASLESSAGASKKLAALEEKQSAASSPDPKARARWIQKLKQRVGKPPPKLINVQNLWTNEILAIEANKDVRVPEDTFQRFFRCHYTNSPTKMDPRLLGVLVGAALKFNSSRIEIVSAFRAPKFNLMLRKKGHEVARDSQHTFGHAVDFRVQGASTADLRRFVRSLGLGGTGYYPNSAFVHADTGPVRTWTGQ